MDNVKILMELPEEVEQLEGHLKWVAEIVYRSSENYQGRLEYARNLLDDVQYHRLYNHEEDEGVEDLTKDCNFHNPKYARSFAYQLNKSVMSVCKGDLVGSLEQLIKLRHAMNELSGDHLRLLDVTKYFLDVLEWSVEKLGQEKGTLIAGNSGKLNTLMNKWKVFQGDDKAKSAILFFKSSLERELNCRNNKEWSNIMLQVISLDPDYHMWYHFAFRAVRQTRRIFKNGNMTAPSSQERELCQKAFDLAPNIILSIYDVGLVLKDCLWMTVYEKTFRKVQPCPVDIDETFQKCLMLFDEALCIAEKCGLHEWTVRCTYQSSLLLLYVKNDEASRVRGLTTMLELVEKNKNAYLHQKLGEIYQYGINIEGDKKILRNPQEARKHFRTALNLEQRNYFSCLRDYMKLISHLRPLPPTKEAFELLTKAMTCTHLLWPEAKVQILIWRGCLLWFFNPKEKAEGEHKKEACQDWLNALETYPEYKSKIFLGVLKPPFVQFVKNQSRSCRICTNQLKEELEKIKLSLMGGPNSSAGTLQAVDTLMEEIERKPRVITMKQDDGNKLDKVNSVEDVNGMNGSLDINVKENQRRPPADKPAARKKAVQCLADLDDNWRAKK